MQRIVSRPLSTAAQRTTLLLFPGQGAQIIGMGSKLCADHILAKRIFDEASEILGYNLYNRCVEGPQAVLDTTEMAQPALYVTSYAAAQVLFQNDAELAEVIDGENPNGHRIVSAGLSLGEYSALAAAGAMSFQDGLKLVRARGLAMQAASDLTPSGMVAVSGLSMEILQNLCEEMCSRHGESALVIGNILTSDAASLSGSIPACEDAMQRATELGARNVTKLAVAGAFHSPFMTPAATQLSEALKEMKFTSPKFSVLSNVDGVAYSGTSEDTQKRLAAQLTTPVRWDLCMQTALSNITPGNVRGYEVGPGSVCRGLALRYMRRLPFTSIPI